MQVSNLQVLDRQADHRQMNEVGEGDSMCTEEWNRFVKFRNRIDQRPEVQLTPEQNADFDQRAAEYRKKSVELCRAEVEGDPDASQSLFNLFERTVSGTSGAMRKELVWRMTDWDEHVLQPSDIPAGPE